MQNQLRHADNRGNRSYLGERFCITNMQLIQLLYISCPSKISEPLGNFAFDESKIKCVADSFTSVIIHLFDIF